MSVFRKITSLFTPIKATVSFTDAEKAMEQEKRRKDFGAFNYEDDGFFYTFMTETRKFNWSDIERIVAYKADLLSEDELCIEISCDNRVTAFTEQTAGWTILIEKLNRHFPDIPNDWDKQLVAAPIDKKITVLYEKKRPELFQ